MRTNIQSNKANRKKSLNLKQSRQSRTMNQCHSIDFSHSSTTGFKGIALFTVLALSLISKPYLAHANKKAVTSNLQTVAKSYAQEFGGVLAQDQWSRVEFSTSYIDPVVVVEGSAANTDNSYVVGIRNVNAMGFEIRIKNCGKSSSIPVQENVNYVVIEKSKLKLRIDDRPKFWV